IPRWMSSPSRKSYQRRPDRSAPSWANRASKAWLAVKITPSSRVSAMGSGAYRNAPASAFSEPPPEARFPFTYDSSSCRLGRHTRLRTRSPVGTFRSAHSSLRSGDGPGSSGRGGLLDRLPAACVTSTPVPTIDDGKIEHGISYDRTGLTGLGREESLRSHDARAHKKLRPRSARENCAVPPSCHSRTRCGSRRRRVIRPPTVGDDGRRRIRGAAHAAAGAARTWHPLHVSPLNRNLIRRFRNGRFVTIHSGYVARNVGAGTTHSALPLLWRQHRTDVHITQLLVGDLGGCAHHQVLRVLIQWEGDRLANVRLVREQHDDPVDAGGDASVRRGAELQGL